MQFSTVGQKENPVIVMINGSFCSAKGLLPIAEALAEEYYVILPTYDGHYENGGEFTTREVQVEKILRYLKEQKFQQIVLIEGTSMGAEVALDLLAAILRDGTIQVKHLYCDGGPFFHFPGFFRAFMRRKFLGVIRTFQKGEPEETIQKFMNSGIARWMLKGDVAPYHDMMKDMSEVAQYLSDESVKRESDACYTFDYPVISEDVQKRILFSYSNNEPARKSEKKMKKCYPYARFENMGDLGHCGFLVRKTPEYIAFVKELLSTSDCEG